MKIHAICLISFISILSITPPVFSADEKPKQEDESAPVRATVTATRREISVEKSTRFVTVLTREDIEKSGAVYIMDILRALPGVTVVQSGPPGRTVGLFVRGMNANQTLVLLDGVQVNSPTTGTAESALADLTTENVVSVDNIERIEILRGPQSTLYGADAAAGVINIVTKTGKKPFGAEGRFEYGTNETFYEAGILEGLWKDLSYSTSVSRTDTEGPGENDQFENTRASGHAKWDVTENSNLDVAFHYYNNLAGIEDGAFNVDPNHSLKSREQVLGVTYTHQTFDAWENSFKYSFFHDAFFDFNPRDPGSTGPDPESTSTPFKIDTDRHGFEYLTHFYLADFDVLTAGYEFEHTETDIKRPSGGFDGLTRGHGWFAQNELTLWEDWVITGGVRIDDNRYFGTEVSPLVSTGYWFEKTQTKFKGSFGKGFKAPTLNELFFPGFGNRNLQAEESWGWDAGFEQFFWDKKGSATVAYFHNSIDNLIQFVGRPTTAQNIAKAKTQGVELETKISPFPNLELRTNYTYLDAVDTGNDKRLTRRPWHSGRAGLSYRYKRLQANLDWVFVGDREELGRIREKNPGYTRLDALVTLDLNKHFQVYFRGENLTDDHYDEALGFDNPTARLFVGTKLKY